MFQFPLLNVRKVPFCIIDSCMDAPILMDFCNLLLLNEKKLSGKIVDQRHGWSPACIGVTWTKLWHHRSLVSMAESKGERASDRWIVMVGIPAERKEQAREENPVT